MIFWRIVDNQVYPVEETDALGFEKSDGLAIPDDYLDRKEFMVMRTAHGIGDWGIISAMPRLLKKRYPECRVYVPTSKFIDHMSLSCWSYSGLNVTKNTFFKGIYKVMPGETIEYDLKTKKVESATPVSKNIDFASFGSNIICEKRGRCCIGKQHNM